MLIVISLFIICILVATLSFEWAYDKNRRIENAIAGLIVSSIISSIILAIIMLASYSSYIGLKQKKVIIHQYVETINLYSKLSVPNKNVVNPLEITDLKYQNYQESIKELVQELRKQVVNYNRVLIEKQEIGNNIVFNYLIITPDKDMKIIKMEDVISVKKV